jgi:hypothetical protein
MNKPYETTICKDLPTKPHCLGEMDIYKHQSNDWSACGLSSRYDDVLVWPSYDKDAPDNAVLIIEDVCCGSTRIRAVPANREKELTMFGGCFIYTCNGVVPYSGIPIPLHDRIES